MMQYPQRLFDRAYPAASTAAVTAAYLDDATSCCSRPCAAVLAPVGVRRQQVSTVSLLLLLSTLALAAPHLVLGQILRTVSSLICLIKRFWNPYEKDWQWGSSDRFSTEG